MKVLIYQLAIIFIAQIAQLQIGGSDSRFGHITKREAQNMKCDEVAKDLEVCLDSENRKFGEYISFIKKLTESAYYYAKYHFQ